VSEEIIESVLDDEEVKPLKVEVTNKDEKEKKDATYDEHDADEYEEHTMSKKEIEEFENGDT